MRPLCESVCFLAVSRACLALAGRVMNICAWEYVTQDRNRVLLGPRSRRGGRGCKQGEESDRASMHCEKTSAPRTSVRINAVNKGNCTVSHAHTHLRKHICVEGGNAYVICLKMRNVITKISGFIWEYKVRKYR